MKTIRLSSSIVQAYKGIKVDISYALSELVGTIDYDYVGRLVSAPMTQIDTMDYELNDEAYEALADVFDRMSSLSEVAEIMLWANYFVGGHL